MHHPTLAFTLSLLTAASLVAVTVVPQPLQAAENGLSDAETAMTVAPLMRQAHFLITYNRADLARGVLQKVLAVQPDHEGALLLLGDLELRSNNNASAQSLWERLLRTRPDSPVTQEMGTLWRLYTTDRLRLTQLRQLRAGGKTAQARVLARQLFPGDVAPGSLASEFSDLLADTPARRQSAIAGLNRKIARDGSPRDRFALHNLQAADRATLPQALQGYAQLAQERSIPADQLVRPWASALRRARAGEAGKEGRTLAQQQEALYQRTMPSELRVAQADRDRSGAGGGGGGGGSGSNDPVIVARVRGYDALGERRHADAEAAFREALRLRPGDASSRVGLGILRLRDGRYAEARDWLDQAVARAPDADSRRDWRELAASARYWEQVGQARTQLADGRVDEAEALLRRTVPLQPEQTEAPLVLAASLLQRGQNAEADRLYADVLSRDPTETRAWRGRFAIGVQQPSAERSADGWLDEAEVQARKLNVPAGDLIDAGALRAAADRELAEGRPGVALRLLERGVALQGQDPWLRHDLARLYLRDGLPDLAKSVMHDGLAQAPQDPQMRYAAALIALSSDREADTLALLEGIPAADRSEAQATLAGTARFEQSMRQYRDGLARGDRDAVQAALATADQNTAGEPTRQLRVARAELGAGQRDAARRRVDRLDPTALSLDDRIEWASVQAAAGRDAVAQRTLAALAAEVREPAQVDAVLQAQRAIAEERIAAALDRGRTAEAQPIAASALSGWPGDERTATARAQTQARLWLAARAPERALAALDATPAPTTPDTAAWAWQRTRIEALAANGRRDEARGALDALHGRTAQAPQAEQLRTIELASDIGEADRAQAWLAPLLAARPTDPDVRLEAAAQSRRAGRYNEAMAHLKAAAPAGPARTSGTPTAAAVPTPAVQSAMNALETRRQPIVEVGYMQTQYSGDDGISTMRSREIPVVVRWPVGYDGHVFAQVDAVKLDAGTLNPGGPGVADFGTAATYGGPIVPMPQRDQGANVGVGWVTDGQRFDIGVIGLGMPVQNLVGGWQRSFTLGIHDIGVEVARRIEARSLMTYVGAVDPNTGNVWGGVTQTFAALRVARPLDETYNLSSRLKLSYYDGQHVQHNVAWQWRSVVDRDFIRSEALTLNAGLAAMLWQFNRNTNFYSYGHGGYYSPQRYFSISVPVEITGRVNTWSYLVRGSLGHSWTREDDAPYYPLNPDLVPAGARYTGGSGGGLGGSLRAAVEKRITPQWSLGAWLDIERSESYSPTRAMIYLRHFFKPQGSPVPVPPQPVVPYSQF